MTRQEMIEVIRERASEALYDCGVDLLDKPVTLSYVMAILDKTAVCVDGDFMDYKGQVFAGRPYWKVFRDDLIEQEDECIQFIYDRVK